MKHIYRFGDKGYVQMDSYPENHETRPGLYVANFLISIVVVGMAAITVGAMAGIDVTNPNIWSNQDAHRISR